ncbi:hypothetical protein PPL_03498 (plasmid) [Heterostelium pallidum]|uniref:Ubiquitin-like protease family profile domain-containing protein n=1 Tax=Heterostelium pallidum (strain ATCC 26659 / Pp 5 / PN500) TaxID=670386 RepID=D3EMQ6_HETP5|nr:hypothetical protein PPL_03498 [Heterostelium pallidum]ADC31705.1 hypothetical protein PPL_03498 [Heterostelium pallidum]|eukprot:YP_003422569.1 hypothetical protein PPL_03498 (plasmid) [Heterostelium pallidum]
MAQRIVDNKLFFKGYYKMCTQYILQCKTCAYRDDMLSAVHIETTVNFDDIDYDSFNEVFTTPIIKVKPTTNNNPSTAIHSTNYQHTGQLPTIKSQQKPPHINSPNQQLCINVDETPTSSSNIFIDVHTYHSNFTLHSLDSILPGHYLNDDVIATHLSLSIHKMYSNCRIGLVNPLTIQHIINEDIKFDLINNHLYSCIIIPIVKSTHWSVLIVFVDIKTVIHYDSLNIHRSSVDWNKLSSLIGVGMDSIRFVSPNSQEFKWICQNNATDCGLFALFFAEYTLYYQYGRQTNTITYFNNNNNWIFNSLPIQLNSTTRIIETNITNNDLNTDFNKYISNEYRYHVMDNIVNRNNNEHRWSLFYKQN